MVLFKDYHIAEIRSGSKTETRREWDEPQVKEGNIYMAVSSSMVPDGVSPIFASHDDCDCYIRVLDVEQQQLGEMTDEEARREGDYEDLEDFKDNGYEAVYGEGSWDPTKEVYRVQMEYVGRSRPESAT